MERNKRAKRHDPYYAVQAYQILAGKSNKDCAEHLGISERTYQNKINGYADLTLPEAQKLAAFLGRRKYEDIFLTK